MTLHNGSSNSNVELLFYSYLLSLIVEDDCLLIVIYLFLLITDTSFIPCDNKIPITPCDFGQSSSSRDTGSTRAGSPAGKLVQT